MLFLASYAMNSILLIGSLRSPPPIRLRRTSPYAGGRISPLRFPVVSYGTLLSTHSAPRFSGVARELDS